MERTEFKKANGDIYLIAERMPDNSYIHARWIGIQTLETVMEGGKFYLKMLLEKPCEKLLNDHHELIGPWNVANEWIVNEWTPKVRMMGLHYMAQVMAPGIYGQMSFQQLHQRIDDKFEIMMFNDEVTASMWLLQVGATAVK
jgi:hypothetical protein